MVSLECFRAPSAGAEWLILSRSPWPQPSQSSQEVEKMKRKKEKKSSTKVGPSVDRETRESLANSDAGGLGARSYKS